MILLLYSSQETPIKNYINAYFAKNPQYEQETIDDFKNWEWISEKILHTDNLFGEKIVYIFKNMPKTKIGAVKDLYKVKPQINIIFSYVDENLAMTNFRKAIIDMGGEVKEFPVFQSKAVFSFLTAISNKSKTSAIKSINEMRNCGENIFLAISFLFTRLEKLILAKEEGGKMQIHANKFTYKELITLQKKIIDLEQRLKSQPVEPWSELEQWVLVNT